MAMFCGQINLIELIKLISLIIQSTLIGWNYGPIPPPSVTYQNMSASDSNSHHIHFISYQLLELWLYIYHHDSSAGCLQVFKNSQVHGLTVS